MPPVTAGAAVVPQAIEEFQVHGLVLATGAMCAISIRQEDQTACPLWSMERTWASRPMWADILPEVGFVPAE